MQTTRTRIARLTAASALTLTLAAAAGSAPALASYQSWAGSAPIDTLAAGQDDSPDGIGRVGGIKSVEDGAGTASAEQTAVTFSSDDDATPNGQMESI